MSLLLSHRTSWVVVFTSVSQEKASCVLVANPDEVVTEKVGSTGVIGMVMGVHEMRDGVAYPLDGRDFVDRLPQVVPDRWRAVENDDSLIGGEKR
jgi:hypothetical protein